MQDNGLFLRLDPQDYRRKTPTPEPDEKDRERHDGLALFIAKSRFAYPSKESPSLKTCVNVPSPIFSVSVSETESLCPDIIVLNTVIGKAATVVEVETQATIDNERALRWKKYERLSANFYLYVPQSSVRPVRELLTFFRVNVSGLRAYSYPYSGDPIISTA